TVRLFANGRFWARASLGPAASGALRLRALSAGLPASLPVRLDRVEVFDSSERESVSVSSAAPSLPPVGAVARPPVHARAEWGARPNKEPYAPTAYTRITLHHTSGPQTKTLPESLREVRFIQDFHQDGRGWSDIAYHFLIDAAGNIFEGR